MIGGEVVADDPIRDGIQHVLDLEDDGDWSVSHYVVCLGLERIVNGVLETCSWVYSQPGQAEYVTDGLLNVSSETLIDLDNDM